MKINKQPRSKKSKIYLITTGAVLLLLIGGLVYVYRDLLPFTSSSNYTKPTDDEVAGENTTEQSGSSNQNDTGLVDNKDSDSTDTSTVSNVKLSITSINQTEDVVQIRTLIEPLTSQGLCKLTLSDSTSDQITKTVDIQAASSYATCMGFDIEKSNLSKGEWKLSVEYKNNENETSEANETIVID